MPSPDPTTPQRTRSENSKALPRPGTILVTLALVAVWGCGAGDSQNERRRSSTTPLVEAIQARSGALPLEQRLTGTLRARNQVAIRPEISATVVDVLARNGESVSAGQPLVRLDESTVREQLQQAEADRQLAEGALAERRARVAELEALVSRTRRLHDESLISELELETQEAQLLAAKASADQASARVAQAAAQLAERRRALERTVVRAPVDGLLGERNAEVGMLVGPDSNLFVIGDVEQLVAEVALTEGMTTFLEVGQSVRLSAPSLGINPIMATLSRISPFLATGSLSTLAEIDLRNDTGRLRPGMFVTVDVFYGESETATLIPTSGIWEDPLSGERGVYVVPGMRELDIVPSGERASAPEPQPVSFRRIQILAEGRGTVGVSGIEEGDWVVTVGHQMLADEDEPVAVVRPTDWERVIDLQNLQREDVLKGFLEKQQELMRDTGGGPIGAAAALTTL